MKLELVWTVIPFVITMGIFVWGSSIYYTMYHAPKEALEVYAVAKQWMWKFQHLDGQREINELHVPVGRKVKVTLTTEDVIHSFFVPAFRIKLDVVPGKYSTVWFEATKPGRYHLFCAEYCGTSHSGMIGWVDVMEASEYQAWLAGGGTEGSLASSGEKLFQQLACITCHKSDGTGRGPVLEGIFGKEVQLQEGGKVVADEGYIRESILNPRAKVVVGFQPIMPTFQGQVSEEQVLQLMAYIKSLGAKPGGAAGAGAKTPQQ
jgi:cytochrome c oxidase subunit 2